MDGMIAGTPRRYDPPPPCRSLIEFFAQRQASGPRLALPVFPTARAEILFNFGDPFCAGSAPDRAAPLPPAALLAPRARAYWQVAGPAIDWFLVALTPLGCRRVLGAPLSALWTSDRQLSDFRPDCAAQLHERLRAAPDFESRVAIAGAALASDHHAATEADPVAILADLARDGTIGSVGELSDALGVGARQLRNRFHSEIGLAPKAWMSLMRFNRHLAASHPRPWRIDPNASSVEYFDDSHVNRAFRRYAAITPARYRTDKASANDGLIFTGLALPLASDRSE